MTPNFKRSAEEFLFAGRRLMKVFRQNRYVNVSYERPILEQFMGKCYQVFPCPDRPSKKRHFSRGEMPTNNKTPTKKLMQTSWLQAKFSVHLRIKITQTPHSDCIYRPTTSNDVAREICITLFWPLSGLSDLSQWLIIVKTSLVMNIRAVGKRANVK